MNWLPTLETVLWAAGVWAVTTAATFVIVALVVATLPITYFRDEATAAGGRPAWWLAGRIARNVAGVGLIVVGIPRSRSSSAPRLAHGCHPARSRSSRPPGSS